MAPKKAPAPASVEAPVQAAGYYATSLFLPWAGIVIALLLMESGSPARRRIARNCLLTGFLVWILLPFLVFLGLFLAAVTFLGGLLSGTLDPIL